MDIYFAPPPMEDKTNTSLGLTRDSTYMKLGKDKKLSNQCNQCHEGIANISQPFPYRIIS